jgi:hypothetical protein
VGLLIGDADHVGHLLLRQTQHDAPLSDTHADMAIDVSSPIGWLSGLRHFLRHGSDVRCHLGGMNLCPAELVRS